MHMKFDTDSPIPNVCCFLHSSVLLQQLPSTPFVVWFVDLLIGVATRGALAIHKEDGLRARRPSLAGRRQCKSTSKEGNPSNLP
eukprot:scaffold24022_cov168-Amphora_coffeaeformis.AAC.7